MNRYEIAKVEKAVEKARRYLIKKGKGHLCHKFEQEARCYGAAELDPEYMTTFEMSREMLSHFFASID